MTGLLTGLHVPGGTNTTAVSINASTGYTVGVSHSHGFFGPYLKMAGFDGIVVLGASKDPVYLWIHDGEAEIRDASKYWGKDTHETEDLIKSELGLEPAKVSVAAVGPAGGTLNLAAGVLEVKNTAFSTTGIGGCIGLNKR